MLSHILWRVRTLVALTSTSVALLGCCLFPTSNDEPEIAVPLEDVIDAVQFAVEEASKTGIWDATAAELKHWGKACEETEAKKAASCFGATAAAKGVCDEFCPGGKCDSVGEALCTQVVQGGAKTALCLTGGATTSARRSWCEAIARCDANSTVAAQACKAGKSIAVPKLKQAKLSVAIDAVRSVEGSASVLVVTFGGSAKSTRSNSVDLTLLPRVRSVDYGVAGLPALPQAKTVSPKAREMAQDLVGLISSAVKAAGKEYEGPAPTDGNVPQTIARPPMALSELNVSFSLSLEKSGKLGLKKEFATPVASVSVGGAIGGTRKNSLTITYARPE